MENTYTYELINCNAGSAKYGNCQVCGKHADTVYHQIEKRYYLSNETGKIEKTTANCFDKFGHAECLKKNRKKDNGGLNDFSLDK